MALPHHLHKLDISIQQAREAITAHPESKAKQQDLNDLLVMRGEFLREIAKNLPGYDCDETTEPAHKGK